jgi:hypothetical protein
VQNKIEALIDKYMESICASKASLSTITTEALWKQSGRYSTNSELLRVKDRRESGFLLSPTHEEEITALVASMVHSYKDLPLRLYQVGRKYRDERRPRGGLLRAKEFMMKDLYTFDSTPEAALETYESVRGAYTAIFDCPTSSPTPTQATWAANSRTNTTSSRPKAKTTCGHATHAPTLPTKNSSPSAPPKLTKATIRSLFFSAGSVQIAVPKYASMSPAPTLYLQKKNQAGIK